MSGAYVPDSLRRAVAERAKFRCEYCQTQEIIVGMPLEIEHIVPISAGGETTLDNLCLACPRCNRYKGTFTAALDGYSGRIVALFHPRQQKWRDHFEWGSNGTEAVGLTPVGRATVQALQMNNPFAVRSRKIWVEKGWHPPQKELN